MSQIEKTKISDKKKDVQYPINTYKFKPLSRAKNTAPESFVETITGQFIERRLTNDRDCKIIVTSRGSSTGLGKTTFAIEKCHDIQDFLPIDEEWTAEKNGFIDLRDYITRYKNCKKFNVLLIDEIEYSADSRRAMSNTNVSLSHAWAQLRYRNIVSICTLPSISMLDKRMLELSDLWINVVNRGIALPFYVHVNDFTGKVSRYQITTNPEHDWAPPKSPEILRFKELTEEDQLYEDYQIMQELKDENVRQDTTKSYDKKDVEQAKKSVKRDTRDEIIYKLYENSNDLTYQDIADVTEWSSSTVSDICNRKRKEESND